MDSRSTGRRYASRQACVPRRRIVAQDVELLGLARTARQQWKPFCKLGFCQQAAQLRDIDGRRSVSQPAAIRGAAALRGSRFSS